jgi:hypothetical protein
VDAAFLSSAEEIYNKMKRGEIFLESEDEKKQTAVVSAQAGAAPQTPTGGKKCCNFD